MSQAAIGQIKGAVFVGTVTVDGGMAYSYKLVVNDSNDRISGYSVTDIGGSDETKTRIRGHFSKSGKQLTFRETRLIHTAVTLVDTDLCFLHGVLKARQLKGTTILKGTFKGYKTDGKTECGRGKLMLVSAQDVLDKMLEVAAKDDVLPKDSTTQPLLDALARHVKEPEESEVKKVTPGKAYDYIAGSSTVTLEIWDAKNTDGDVVTLMKGNTILLDKLRIARKHKSLIIDVGDADVTTLRLVAVSEGSEALNTARISIASGGNTEYIDATTTIGNDVFIRIRRQP